MPRIQILLPLCLLLGVGCTRQETSSKEVVPAYCLRDAPLSQAIKNWPATALSEAAGFTYGFGTGDVDATGAVFWTHYSGEGTLQLELARYVTSGSEEMPWSLRPAITVTPDADGFVHLELTDLEPCADYRYAYVVKDATGRTTGRSRIGRFRTPPLEDAKFPVSFIMSGDTDAAMQPFDVVGSVASDRESSFFVFNGDLIYEHECHTVEDYRGFYRQNWSDPSLQSLFASMPVYSIWDDHDVVVDWNGSNTPAERITAGRTALLNFNGIRRNPQAPERLWRAYQWGSIVDLIVTDSRSEVIDSGTERRFWSRDQMDWLKGRLLHSKATFKFVVVSLPLGTWPIYVQERIAWYPEQRTELLSWIKDNQIQNVYFLSADHHAVILAGMKDCDCYDFTGGPIGADLAGDVIQYLPQADESVFFADGFQYNYLRLTADPTATPPEVTLRAVRTSGEVFYERRFTTPLPADFDELRRH